METGTEKERRHQNQIGIGAATEQRLLFISVKDPKDLKQTQTQKRIRRHVMKNVTRAKRQIKSVVLEGTDILDSQQSRLPLLPYFVPPVEWRFYMPGFLNNWMTCKKISSKTENSIHAAQGMLLEMSIHSQALFHGILALSAAYHHKLSYGRVQQIAWYHVGQAITQINNTLSNSRRGVPDDIILAVVLVAAFENLRGNSEACRMHLGGLQNMVNIRGGQQNISLVLKYAIYWLDCSYATATSSRPLFPMQATEFELSVPTSTVQPEVAATFLGSSLRRVVAQLRKLTEIVDSSYSKSVSLNEMWEFVFLRTRADQALLSMPFELEFSAEKNDPVNVAVEAIRVAALIYTNLVLRCISIHSKIHRSLSVRLADLMGRIDNCLEREQTGNLKILLWAAALGGAVVSDVEAKSKLEWSFRILCDQLGVDSWEKCHSIMTEAVFSRRGCGDLCAEFYYQATVSRKSKSKYIAEI